MYCDFDLSKARTVINEREGFVYNQEEFDLISFNKSYGAKLNIVQKYLQEPKKIDLVGTQKRLIKKFVKLYEERTPEK